jgi:hypothetical protein
MALCSRIDFSRRSEKMDLLPFFGGEGWLNADGTQH